MFVSRRNDQGGFYELLFRASTTPQWLLLPYLVNNFVAEKKLEHMRLERDAADKPENRRSVADKQAVSRAWIKFADQAFVGTIALYLRNRIEFSQSNLKEILKEDLLDALLPVCYALAVRDLAVFFRNHNRTAVKRKETFVPANYLKGNWGEIREWLEEQEEYREGVGEDPLAAFPMLARKGA
jgi:hypothetical protein